MFCDMFSLLPRLMIHHARAGTRSHSRTAASHHTESFLNSSMQFFTDHFTKDVQ